MKTIAACVTTIAVMCLTYLAFCIDSNPFGDEKAARADVAKRHREDLAARRARIAALRAERADVQAKLDEDWRQRRPDRAELDRHRSDLDHRIDCEESDLRWQEGIHPENWPLVPDRSRPGVEFPREGFPRRPKANLNPD